MPAEKPVCCKHCGMPFGVRAVDAQGNPCVIINGLAINTISGACLECGTVYYYSQKAEGLEVLLKDIIERKQAYKKGAK